MILVTNYFEYFFNSEWKKHQFRQEGTNHPSEWRPQSHYIEWENAVNCSH